MLFVRYIYGPHKIKANGAWKCYKYHHCSKKNTSQKVRGKKGKPLLDYINFVVFAKERLQKNINHTFCLFINTFGFLAAALYCFRFFIKPQPQSAHLYIKRHTLHRVSTHKRCFEHSFRKTFVARTRVLSVRTTCTFTTGYEGSCAEAAFAPFAPLGGFCFDFHEGSALAGKGIV